MLITLMMDVRFENRHVTKKKIGELQNKQLYKYLPTVGFSSFTSVFIRVTGAETNFRLFVIIDE